MSNTKREKKTGLGRREFVKTSTLAAGGAILVPNMMAAKAHIGGDDAIKIALIGCGGRGTGAVTQALSTKENVRLVAMADAFRDRLDDCYKNITAENVSDWSGMSGNFKDRIQVPEEHKFAGFDAYLKAIPLAAVVILTTPPGCRPIHF